MKDYPVFIYALGCPICRFAFYVGRSVNPESRLVGHRYHKMTPTAPKQQWLDGLKKIGLIPEIWILEETTAALSRERENFWIITLWRAGNPLENGIVPDEIREDYTAAHWLPMKRCYICGRLLPNTPANFFRTPTATTDGLSPQCLQCW